MDFFSFRFGPVCLSFRVAREDSVLFFLSKQISNSLHIRAPWQFRMEQVSHKSTPAQPTTRPPWPPCGFTSGPCFRSRPQATQPAAFEQAPQPAAWPTATVSIPSMIHCPINLIATAGPHDSCTNACPTRPLPRAALNDMPAACSIQRRRLYFRLLFSILLRTTP